MCIYVSRIGVQALMQLRSGLFILKVAALVGMSQSYVAHMRKDIGGELERRRGGCLGVVSFLLLKVDLELHLRQQNNFNLKHVSCCLTSL